jgi:hypothetical protein
MTEAKSKLEQIFALEDAAQRVPALVEYARSLKVNVLKARKENGDYSEDQLAVLIYDVEQRKKDVRAANVGLVIVAVFIFLVIAAGIVLTYYMVSSSAKKGETKQNVLAALEE